jgi:hypothetical protein
MIKIIGAGMAGLLAANMLRRRGPVVFEKQAALPHNHSAVLRFRTPLVGEVLGVPFKRVRVLKTVIPWRNPAADAMAYSMKVLGEYRTDRSILPGTELVDRWIAPPDLIERMAEGIDTQYGCDVDIASEGTKVISTLPMPSLMRQLHYEHRPLFGYVNGVNIRAEIKHCEAYLTVYVPNPHSRISRISITGDELIVELSRDVQGTLFEQEAREYLTEALGMIAVKTGDADDAIVKKQQYAKIAPIDEVARKDFIHWASSIQEKAFSLGRYATWRPGLLLDDLVKDVRFIDKMIDSKYEGGMHRWTGTNT